MAYNKVVTNMFSSSHDLAARTRWYVYLRWFILLLIILPGLASLYIGDGWSEKLESDTILGLVAFATNAIFYLFSRFVKKHRTIQALATAIFVIDTAMITYFIYTKGGIDSRSVMIYVIPIIMSAAIFGRKGTYAFSILSMFAYSTLLMLNYFGILASPNPMIAARQTDFPSVINTLIFFNSLLILISLAVDFIAQILISKERQALQNLEDLRRAQSIARFGSWEWQKDTNQITWSNELYRIFDVTPGIKPMTFQQYLQLIHPDDRQLLANTIEEAAKKNRSFSIDHRIFISDGSLRYIHSDGQSITDSQGVVQRMIGTARDITDTTLLEKAKNDFVSLTSHQLRTPATIVKQYAVMLDEGYAGELNAKQKSFLKTIYDSNERQISIINDLLNIARIDSGNFTLNVERTDLVALLSEITAEHAGKFKSKQQKLIFKPKYKKVYCEIDGDQLRMGIENLLDNAHKYTSNKKAIKIELQRKKSFVSIAVTDSGVGIPTQDIHKLFNMFSKIENPIALEQEGTGIGLYWVKKIVTMHGGTIAVESELRKGTTFTIELPYKHTGVS
ncbi:MAG TPA: ATP-binding protein [Candidatus Saccharimonadales bacterium]|nr:ATP-binding protein [Candidatus Saccharimonadales bacterium]